MRHRELTVIAAAMLVLAACSGSDSGEPAADDRSQSEGTVSPELERARAMLKSGVKQDSTIPGEPPVTARPASDTELVEPQPTIAKKSPERARAEKESLARLEALEDQRQTSGEPPQGLPEGSDEEDR